MKNSVLSISLFLCSISLVHAGPAPSPFQPLTPDLVPPGSDYGLKQPDIENPDLFRGKRVAILASHGVEESEIRFSYEYLQARGAQVDILVPWWTEKGVVTSNFVRNTGFVVASGTFRSALKAESHYDLIVLTGGAWNGQVVSGDDDAKQLVEKHFQAGRPLAAICKGTELLIHFGLIQKGMQLTGPGYSRIHLINAGATFLDQPVVTFVDEVPAGCKRAIMTSRDPHDLVPFVGGLKQLLIQGF